MTPGHFRVGRRALNITQAELAEVMGYSSQSAVSAIENAATDVPAQAARLMLAYLSGYRPHDWSPGRRGAEK